MLQRALDEHHQVFRIDRLVLKMIGAALGGFDRGVERRVAGEDDHFRFGPLFFDGWQQIEAMPVRQLQVKQHCIRLGTFKRGLRRRRTLGRNDFVTLRLEQRVHQITHVRVVVHHHDSRFHTGRFRLGSHSRVKPRNSSKKTSCVSNNRSG